MVGRAIRTYCSWCCEAGFLQGNRTSLSFGELEEVILDVEVAVNNRPLSYVEDDVELPVLTPVAMMQVQPNIVPEVDADSVENADLRKRARYLRHCKDVMWSRWIAEYIRSLREWHNLKHKSKELTLKVGDVVLIQSEDRAQSWQMEHRHHCETHKGTRWSRARSKVESGKVVFGARDPTFMSNGTVL